MNILFLTLSSMENLTSRGIYTDLVREFARRKINLYVVSPREKRNKLPTEMKKEGRVNILKVRIGDITKAGNLLKKGLSTLTIERHYLNAMNKYFSNIRFDMIIYSTPPITFERVISYYKKRHKGITYLMLKDIFPQNAVDLGMMRKGGILWRYFRNKEKRLYKNSDFIGCMSQGNVDYLLEHNPYLDKNKVEIFPNAIQPIPKAIKNTKANAPLKKYGVPHDSVLFVYGGNLGKPQGIDYLLKIIDEFHKVDNGYLLIIGSGTEYKKIKGHIDNSSPDNVGLLSRLPKKDYDELLQYADVGLIFLDRRFTIPNIPSRLTSYMESSLPILAATDIHTDLKDILKESGSGYWVESSETKPFINYAQKLALNENLREEMGAKGRKYLEDNYHISKTIDILLKHLPGDEKYV